MLIRSLVLALMALSTAVQSAHAEQPIGIRVVEYGIYSANAALASNRSEAGAPRLNVRNICHVATASTVPARRDLHFGFRYIVTGGVPGQIVDLTQTMRFPEMRPPGVANARTDDSFDLKVKIGVTRWTGFTYGRNWPLVLGAWQFTLSNAGRTLAKLNFEVVDAAGTSLPPAVGTECFPIS